MVRREESAWVVWVLNAVQANVELQNTEGCKNHKDNNKLLLCRIKSVFICFSCNKEAAREAHYQEAHDVAFTTILRSHASVEVFFDFITIFSLSVSKSRHFVDHAENNTWSEDSKSDKSNPEPSLRIDEYWTSCDNNFDYDTQHAEHDNILIQYSREEVLSLDSSSDILIDEV